MELYHHTLRRSSSAIKSLYFPPNRLLLLHPAALSLYQSLTHICTLDTFAMIVEGIVIDYNHAIISLDDGSVVVLRVKSKKEGMALQIVHSEPFDNSYKDFAFHRPIIANHLSYNPHDNTLLMASAISLLKLYSLSSLKLGQNKEKPAISLTLIRTLRYPAQVIFNLAIGEGQHGHWILIGGSDENGQKYRRKLYVDTKSQEGWKLNGNQENAYMMIFTKSQQIMVMPGQIVIKTKGKMHGTKTIPLPSRINRSGVLFAAYCESTKGIYLLTEHGDLLHFISTSQNLLYLCSLPISTSLINLGQNRFFCTAEASNHMICQIQQTSNPKPAPQIIIPEEHATAKISILFKISHPNLITDMQIASDSQNKDGSSGDIYLTATGRGDGGSLIALKSGLKVTLMTSIAYQAPLAIFSIKQSASDVFHSHIVLSYPSRTTSLVVSSTSFQTCTTLRLDYSSPTLAVARLQDDSLLQVTPYRVRIAKEKETREIDVHGVARRAAVVVGGKQVAVGMDGGLIKYYQIDQNGVLSLVKEMQLDSDICCLDFYSNIDQSKSNFSQALAVCTLNYHITIFTLPSLTAQLTRNLKGQIESIILLKTLSGWESQVGMTGGKLIRLWKEGEQNVELQERKIGDKPIKIIKMQIDKIPAILKITSKISLAYQHNNRELDSSLNLPAITIANQLYLPTLSSSSIITYFDGYLQIYQIQGFGMEYHEEIIPLDLSGRKVLLANKEIIVVEGDVTWPSISNKSEEMKDQTEEAKYKKQSKKQWIGQITLFSLPLKKLSSFKTPINYKCLCLLYLPSSSQSVPSQLIVSVCPSSQCSPLLQLYLHYPGRLQLQYSTEMEGPVTALSRWRQGSIIAGVGKSLRILQICKTKFISKAVRHHLSSFCVSVHSDSSMERVFTTSQQDSFQLWQLQSGSFTLIADDILPRYVSSACIMDDDFGVMAGGDRFGNIFVGKINQRIRDQGVERRSGGLLFQDHISKFDSLAHFHLGGVPIALQIGKLQASKKKVLISCTSDGQLSIFSPFEPSESNSHALLTNLQTLLQESSLPFANLHRKHINYYNPCRGVLDGDLIEKWRFLEKAEKEKIAQTIGQSMQKMEETIRSMIDGCI